MSNILQSAGSWILNNEYNRWGWQYSNWIIFRPLRLSFGSPNPIALRWTSRRARSIVTSSYKGSRPRDWLLPYFPSHLFSASTYLHIRYLILSLYLSLSLRPSPARSNTSTIFFGRDHLGRTGNTSPRSPRARRHTWDGRGTSACRHRL